MAEDNSPCPGSFQDGIHVYPLRVYYEDTDAAGIVYYANYLKFAERARTEMMHLLDVGYRDLVAQHSIAFAVRRVEAEQWCNMRWLQNKNKHNRSLLHQHWRYCR